MATYYVATTGNDTTGDGSSGNPWRTPGKAAGTAVAGDVVFIKYNPTITDYDLTTNTANVSGGPVAPSVSENGLPLIFCGYDTTATLENTDTNRPTVGAGVRTGISVFAVAAYGGGVQVRNIIVDAVATSNKAFDLSSTGGVAINCTGKNGSQGFNGGQAYRCFAENCTTGFNNNSFVRGCRAKNCTTGFSIGGKVVGCVATGGATAFYMNGADNGGNLCLGNIAYGPSGDGFYIEANRVQPLALCFAMNCGGRGFFLTATGNAGHVNIGSGGYNNTGGHYNSAYTAGVNLIGFLEPTASPFVDAAAGDFNLNNTASAGALLRAVTYDLPTA